MNTAVCNICKEPAWNFMCMNCVAKDIMKFLPKKLAKSFSGFHECFSGHADSPRIALKNAVHCFSCRSTKENQICSTCYTGEVYNWLKERNDDVAQRFSKMFCFGGQRVTAAADCESDEEFGICDECGEYTETLVSADGELVCMGCSCEDV